ncbi:MAG: CoB--CoM heterodisulfide reductase iron-sulfur subunit B family protein [Deltaproteobacteria bacterium]|nr:CoB--CoM heterodisulfide reductase iron-sulfur subunit B family protein [Deltaproteobacteria bacterium]
MKYQYYPGCSLEATALEYNRSTRAVMAALGAELIEIEDWTCCGASAAHSTSYLLSLALPARNLAIAEKYDAVTDLLVPCSACYLNLKQVEEKTRSEPDVLAKVNTILNEDQLQISGRIHVRHLLDVFVSDFGPEPVRKKLKRAFTDFRIAPYYGCQCLRPYALFDNPEDPRSMEPLIEAAGAQVHHWNMGGKCCGASQVSTNMGVGLELVAAVLKGAKGADAIVTVCPMCQMNLEAYQQKICRTQNEDLRMTVLYLPQLIGLALGLPEKDLRLDLNLSITDRFRKKLDVSQ